MCPRLRVSCVPYKNKATKVVRNKCSFYEQTGVRKHPFVRTFQQERERSDRLDTVERIQAKQKGVPPPPPPFFVRPRGFCPAVWVAGLRVFRQGVFRRSASARSSSRFRFPCPPTVGGQSLPELFSDNYLTNEWKSGKIKGKKKKKTVLEHCFFE